MSRWKLGAAVAVALLWPLTAAAQVTTATVQGRVVDESNAPVPGATITARNTDTGASRTATTDAGGGFRIAALPVGSYEVTAALAGFATKVRSGLTLTVGQEANLEFSMKMAPVAETVTVVGDAPVVETTKTTLGKTITTKQLDELPVSGRNFTNLAFLSPGILVNASTGGTTIAAGGATGRNNAFVIDGLTNDEVAVSATRGETSLDAIREFQVLSNQFSAEFGQASGAVINVLTRSGTNDFEGRVFTYYRADPLAANDPFATRNPTTGEVPKAKFTQKVFGGFLGGPVQKDRTFFFLSYDHTVRDETGVVSVADNVLRAFNQSTDKNIPQPTRNPRFLAKLDHRLSPDQTLSFRARYDHQTQANVGVGGVNTIERGYDFTRTDQDYALSHTWVISPRALNEFRGQYAHRFLDFNVDNYCAHCPTINRPSINLGKANNLPQGRTEKRFQFVDTLSFNVLNRGGDHYFKAGADVSLVDLPFFFHNNLDGTFTFATDAPFNAADRSTYPTTYTRNTGDPTLDLKDNIYSLFVQDQWRLTPYLTFNLGARYDFEDSLSTSQDKDNVSPRFHFAWDPLKDGKTSIRGGWGRYIDQVFLNIPINAAQGTSFVGITITNPGYPDPFVGGTLRAPPPPSTVVFAPDLNTPYSDSFSLGFQRELFRDVALSVDAVYTHGKAQLLSIDTNYTINGIARPDPNFGRKIMTQSIGESKYKALQVGLDKRFSRRYSFGLAYTLSETKRNVEDFNFTAVDHRNIDAEWGYGTNDARHTLGGSLNVDAPWGVKLGLGGRYRSALPYNITTGLDNNQDTFVNDRPAGVARNSARGSAVWTIDTRLAKAFRFGRRSLETIVEAFNVLNHPSLGTYIGNQRSAQFGKPTATVANFAPRQIQLGLRLNF
jgi:outer membrane receptor for ferrienterochelin and colicin